MAEINKEPADLDTEFKYELHYREFMEKVKDKFPDLRKKLTLKGIYFIKLAISFGITKAFDQIKPHLDKMDKTLEGEKREQNRDNLNGKD